MSVITTVVQFPNEPRHILIKAAKGFRVDPQIPPSSGSNLQPLVGGRRLYIAGGKIKALPEAAP